MSEENKEIRPPVSEVLDVLYGNPEGEQEPTEPPVVDETPKDEAEPPEDDSKAPDGSEEPTDEPVAEDADEDEPQAEQSDDEPVAEDESEDTGDREVATFSELAEHLDVDEDYLRGLVVTDKVNGKEVEFTVSEALATHRKVRAADEVLSEAKAKRTQILDEANAQKDVVAETIAAFATVLEDVKASAKAAYDSIDWKQLRVDDPAEHSAKQLEFRETNERIAKLEEQGRAAYRASVEKMREQELAAMKSRLPEEIEQLQKKLPEWKDEKKATAEQKAVAKFMSDEGFSSKDIEAAAYDSRYLSLAVKAMRYDESLKTKAKAKEKLQRPKLKVTPRGRKPEVDSKPKAGPKTREQALYG